MAYALPVKYYNSFLLKKASSNLVSPYAAPFNWPGLPWNPAKSAYDGTALSPVYPTFPFGSGVTYGTGNQWYLEEARIKGGFNNTSVDFGVRAYAVEESNAQPNNQSSLIYSGILNNATGFNATNVFSIGENITKGFNPADGSIQKLYAADTNVIVFQESKVNKILINKNTVYSGDQGAQESALTRVLGQIYPYAGAFGISKNPESFAVFGNRKYFVDQNQGLVLRLSNDGFTPVSAYGMRDYFRDTLATVSTNYRPVIVEQSFNLTVDADGNLSIPVVSGDVACNFQAGSSIYLNGLPVENNKTGGNLFLVGTVDPITAGITSTTSITTAGSGYTAGLNGTTGGSGDGNLAVTIGVDGGGGITSATVYTPGNGYKVGDVVTVVGTGTLGTLTVTAIVNETIFIFGEDNVQFWTPAPPISATTAITLGFETREIGRIFGAWDIHDDSYAVSIQSNNGTANYATLTYSESSRGWVSRHSYKPQFMDSMRDKFYSTNQGSIWQHYDNVTVNNRTNYYGTRYDASIEFVLNQKPSVNKNFLTLGYEGSNGWQADFFKSDFEGFNYEYYTTPVGGYIQNQDTAALILSNLKGRYEINTPTNTGTNAVTPPFEYAGFVRKENRYVANLINNSVARGGEVIFGSSMSGIKGYYSTVQLSTDNTTEPGGEKELFLVSSTFSVSSY